MSETRRIAFLVPAYNVRPWDSAFVERLNDAFEALRGQHGLETVVVFVDDGSIEAETRLSRHTAVLQSLDARVFAVRHPINRGQGAALQTAIEIARSPRVDAEYFVTFDSDGQHNPKEVPRMFASLRQGDLNIVFGNRFAAAKTGNTGIPATRRMLLKMASAFERLVTGLALTDAHNGLRVFDRVTAEKLELQQDRMAHATELKSIVSREKLRYGEAPVTITYSQESLRGGQKNSDAVRVLSDLMKGWWFR